MSYIKNFFLRMPYNNRILLGGNILEYFDLYLYVHFALMVSQKFFPPGFEKTAYFQAFTFCQIYFLAPIACMVFSYMGDKHGRRPVILHTALLMAIASCFILFLPTYETWGEKSTILLIILRTIQGIAMAGEPLAANLYLIENSSMNRDSPWYTQAPWYGKLMAITEHLGGLCALIVGFLSLYFFKNFSHGWRAPFLGCCVFVFIILYYRHRLTESPEYIEATSNGTASIFRDDERGFWYLTKTMHYYKRNVVCWGLMLLTYPILFNICFLQISPRVVGVDAPLENLLFYNVIISTGTILCGLNCAYFPLRYKWNLRWTVLAYVLIGSIFAYFAIWGVENNLPLPFVSICQILMMSLINFGLVIPGLIKVLPVIGRYTLMGVSWSLARFTNFFLIAFGLQAIKEVLGLYGCLYLLYGLATLGLFAVWYHVCYYTIDGKTIMRHFKEGKKVEGELHIMTQEEVKEYIYGASKTSKKPQ